MEIDYTTLAKEIIKIQVQQEEELFRETVVPIGVVSERLRKNHSELEQEHEAFEALLSDVLVRKASYMYRIRSNWEAICNELGIEVKAEFRINTLTGEVFKVSRGYEELKRKLQYVELQELALAPSLDSNT